MNDFFRTPSEGPQLRTLLLTDLVDSTGLVERLGDTAAAQLFREHDQLVLKLQQQWRGRLIDRSDGLLLLFERPVDGLGFALDYTRGLRDLGKPRNVVLQARAGLHVGEVLTWKNSDAAVQVGAKPLEVEGLAKPMAARLMTLARPGQILLSSVAEPLTHRASRELGERGKSLLWKSYGRWRFKGVPQAQEIHEVGEVGLAPLRAPSNNPKAWRDIPLWRRPAALAAEVVVLAGLGIGAWFLGKPQPAIAFAERDWVVVGDLRNLTGEKVLDDSLEQAFRISLEQSRYVNLLSDLKARDTLALMQRQPDTLLDRAVASEIALRDGARAVILPTVAEVGGRLRFSAEVIDPRTQTTVYAESADGMGVGSALGSIDTVTGRLRGKLGEALASVEKDSAPLPQVSTRNLDALRAYALGEKKMAVGDAVAALGYFRRALELDPEFTLARIAVSRVQIAQGNLAAGRESLESAASMRSRLTSREKLALDISLARFGPVPTLLSRWQQLLETYPDTHSAHLGLANDGWMMANQYAEALPHARAATAMQYVDRARAQYLEGMLLLGLDRYPEAIRAYEASRNSGFKGAGSTYAYAYEAQRKTKQADRIFASRGGTAVGSENMAALEYRFVTGIDRGNWKQALSASEEANEKAERDDPVFLSGQWRIWGIASRILAEGETVGQRHALQNQLRWLEENAEAIDRTYAIYGSHYQLAIGYLAARTGDRETLDTVLGNMRGNDLVEGHPVAMQMHQVLLAEHDRMSGRADSAVARLKTLTEKDDALSQVHSALGHALRDSGDIEGALVQARWISSHRGRVFVERGISSLLEPMAIADTTLAHLESAELLSRLGRKDEANQEIGRFLAIWRESDLPDAWLVRARAVKG